jgi:transposase
MTTVVWLKYYGCAVAFSRVRQPRDKGNVEMSVGLVARQVIAAPRSRTFMSITELNVALQDKVDAINDKPFRRGRGAGRASASAKRKMRSSHCRHVPAK